MAYFLWLAGFIAVAGVGCAIRSRSVLLGKLLLIFGCVGCAGLVLWQIRDTVTRSTELEPDRYHVAASYTLAFQVGRQMAGKNGVVVLVHPPTQSIDPDVAQSLTYAFARVLQSSPSLKLRQTNLVAGTRSDKTVRWTLASFEQAFAGMPDDVAYVSFAGVPPGIEDLALFQQANAPRLFVFDPLGTTDWLVALKKGVIRCVVVPRPDARPAREEISGRPEEIFTRFFLMATPETADQVAAEIKRR